VSPDVSARTFELVPQQDFTSSSDINWDVKVDDLDEQFFRKYNLAANEIEFVKKQIKSIT